MKDNQTLAQFYTNYQKIKSVYNPFFEEDIVFDVHGYKHLTNQGDGKARTLATIQERFGVFEYVPELLTKKISPKEYQLRKKTTKKGMLIIDYYTFVFSVVLAEDEFRLKVVIRQKLGEPKKFFSCFRLVHTKFSKTKTP